MSMILVSTALFSHVCKQEAPIGWITHNDAMITRDQNQAITDGDLIMGPFQDPFRNFFFAAISDGLIASYGCVNAEVCEKEKRNSDSKKVSWECRG